MSELDYACELPMPLLSEEDLFQGIARARQKTDRFITREEWGARPKDPGPGALTPARVRGVALHWPGMKGRLDTVSEVSAALRNWQAFHMDDKGWSDIAYQTAFDQKGNRYRLRGMRNQSAANGDTRTNEEYGAFLLVLGIGETPSDQMINAVRRGIHGFRHWFPRGRLIVSHREIRPEPTQCAGDIVQKMLNNGVFKPRRKP